VRETLFALGILVVLILVAVAMKAADTLMLVYGGVGLVVAGLLFSTPCAIVYHWLLYRALSPRGALDKRWLLNPTGQHKRLLDEERDRVMPWFYAGAAGWGVSVIGCAVLGIAALTIRGQ
jgi:hypothetical protein